MKEAVLTLERGFHAEKLDIGFVCESESHMKLVRYFVTTELLRLGNDDELFSEIAYNVFELYNKSRIYIVRPEQCWKLNVNEVFIFGSKNGKTSAVRSCINSIKDIHLL
jgi:hypothetical protein